MAVLEKPRAPPVAISRRPTNTHSKGGGTAAEMNGVWGPRPMVHFGTPLCPRPSEGVPRHGGAKRGASRGWHKAESHGKRKTPTPNTPLRGPQTRLCNEAKVPIVKLENLNGVRGCQAESTVRLNFVCVLKRKSRIQGKRRNSNGVPNAKRKGRNAKRVWDPEESLKNDNGLPKGGKEVFVLVEKP
jgi:hypothetical protein